MDALEGIPLSGPMIQDSLDFFIGNRTGFNDFVGHGSIIVEGNRFINTNQDRQ
jgi:hypothetical protein